MVISTVKGDDFSGKVLGLTPFTKHAGVFYPRDHINGKLLAVMILEAAIVFAWGLVMSLAFFGVLKLIRLLGVSCWWHFDFAGGSRWYPTRR